MILSNRRNRRFTPVPKNIQDGSEDVDHVPAAVLSGAPKELQGRTVRYARSNRNLMVSSRD